MDWIKKNLQFWEFFEIWSSHQIVEIQPILNTWRPILGKANRNTNRCHHTTKWLIIITGKAKWSILGKNHRLRLKCGFWSTFWYWNEISCKFSIQQTIQESRFGPNCVSECSMNGHSDQCWLIEFPRHFPRTQRSLDYHRSQGLIQ